MIDQIAINAQIHVIMVSLEQVYWFSNSQWHMLMVKSICSHLMISNLLLFFSI